jgi:hypothetical protein
MALIAAILGIVLIMTTLWDAFETVILPRRVTHRIRFTRLFYRRTWLIWKVVVREIASHKRQETIFSFYGPLSLLLLLTIWAVGSTVSPASYLSALLTFTSCNPYKYPNLPIPCFQFAPY